MCKKKTTEQFIEDAKRVHGDKYDYSLVEYVNNSTKLIIICKAHGEFKQTGAKHIMGRGCRKCATEKSANRLIGNTKNFIEKAKLVHGDRYDYSLVNYKSSAEAVDIICKEHGVFKQQPNNHLSGASCNKCSKNKVAKGMTRTNEEFIKKCKEIYEDKYDYSLVKYENCKKPIKIICKLHGEFEVTGDVFLNNGNGCAKCKDDKRVLENKYNFLKRAEEIHGDKYDYSLVEYKNNSTKVKIICKKHGIFEQRPLGHLQGNACTECGKECREGIKQTNEEFIKKSIETHGNTYDYSETNYLGSNINVDIICKIHGRFSQNPSRHKRGAGCTKCNADKKSKDYRNTTEGFIEKAVKIHNKKYDYSLVEYIHSREPIKIICQTHGVFEQKPYHHLLNKGCKECSKLFNVYKKEDYVKLSEKATLYLIKVYKDDEEFYKIGKTKDSVKKDFQTQT